MGCGGWGVHYMMAGGDAPHKNFKILKTISKNFEINFGRFREILMTFSKSISENFDN